MNERPDIMVAEPANAAFFCGIFQIRRAESERVEGLTIVHEADPEAVPPPPERHGDCSVRRMRPATMLYGVGEELIENDQKPRPLVIRQGPLVRELDGKGLKPGELRGVGTQRDRRSLHRRLLILLPN